MPNWANVSYYVEGDRIEELCNDIDRIEEVKGDVDSTWYGCWLGSLLEINGIDSDNIRCRGGITDYGLDTDKKFLRINCECAWGEMDEWRHKMEEIYDAYFYYCVVEPGMSIYRHNDPDGKYFKLKYHVDISDWDIYEDVETVDDIAELLVPAGYQIDMNTDLEHITKWLEEKVEAKELDCYCIEPYDIEH